MSEADEPDGFGPYDHDHPPPLDFERWAALAASLVGVDPDDRIDHLTARGTDPALFDACEMFWATTLARQIQRGDLGLAKRYAAIAIQAAQRHEAEPADRAAAVRPQRGPVGDETGFLTALPDEAPLPFKRDALAARPTPREAPARADAGSMGSGTEFLSADQVAAINETLPFAAEAPMDIAQDADLARPGDRDRRGKP